MTHEIQRSERRHPSRRALLKMAGCAFLGTAGTELLTIRPHSQAPALKRYGRPFTSGETPTIFIPGAYDPTDGAWPAIEQVIGSGPAIGLDQTSGYSTDQSALALAKLDHGLKQLYPEGFQRATVIATSMGALALVRYLELGGNLPGHVVLESPVGDPGCVKMPLLPLTGGEVSGVFGLLVNEFSNTTSHGHKLDETSSTANGRAIIANNQHLSTWSPKVHSMAYAEELRALANEKVLPHIGKLAAHGAVLLQDPKGDAVLDSGKVAATYGRIAGLTPTAIPGMEHAGAFLYQPVATARVLRSIGIKTNY